MNPYAGTPFAFWMTSMMCWANFVTMAHNARRR